MCLGNRAVNKVDEVPTSWIFQSASDSSDVGSLHNFLRHILSRNTQSRGTHFYPFQLSLAICKIMLRLSISLVLFCLNEKIDRPDHLFVLSAAAVFQCHVGGTPEAYNSSQITDNEERKFENQKPKCQDSCMAMEKHIILCPLPLHIRMQFAHSFVFQYVVSLENPMFCYSYFSHIYYSKSCSSHVVTLALTFSDC